VLGAYSLTIFTVKQEDLLDADYKKENCQMNNKSYYTDAMRCKIHLYTSIMMHTYVMLVIATVLCIWNYHNKSSFQKTLANLIIVHDMVNLQISKTHYSYKFLIVILEYLNTMLSK